MPNWHHVGLEHHQNYCNRNSEVVIHKKVFIILYQLMKCWSKEFSVERWNKKVLTGSKYIYVRCSSESGLSPSIADTRDGSPPQKCGCDIINGISDKTQESTLELLPVLWEFVPKGISKGCSGKELVVYGMSPSPMKKNVF